MQNYNNKNQEQTRVLYTIKSRKRVEYPLLHGIYELFAQIKSVSNKTFKMRHVAS
jgi:hypothetical protein